MKNIQKQLSKCVIALSFITGFQCAAPAVAVIFIPLIAAKQWTNVLDSTNTFFFIVAQDSTNKSSFTGNENLPDGTQASFTGAFENHDIHFTYEASSNSSRSGKTYAGTVNDASNLITLTGTDASGPLPAINLKAQ